MNLYNIAIPTAVHSLYTYKSKEEIHVGCRVIVSFGNRNITGFVWSKIEKSSLKNIKLIKEIIDAESFFSKNMLTLASWISDYYISPIGLVLQSMIPTGAKIELLESVRRKIDELLIYKSMSLLSVPSEWISIKELKKIHKKHPLLEILHYFEANGWVEFKHKIEKKIKPKTIKYVVKKQIKEQTLTSKQADVYYQLKEKETPLEEYSFSSHMKKILEKKELIEIKEVEFDPYAYKPCDNPIKKTLNKDQKEAFDIIEGTLEKTSKKPILLYGITGSGKTEVYIHSISKVLDKGRNAILLLPEIALTPQMVHRFYNAFNHEIAVLHSNLSQRKRWETWKRVKKNNIRIILGVRSAIFAPVENVGIIIVDEEHEQTYKQDNQPRYNARDLAIVRAKLEDAVVILGSATPSLETWKNAREKKFLLLQLLKRAKAINLPNVVIHDMKKEEKDRIISDVLAEKINEKLKKNEQVILFQNRRGFSSFVQCVSCGLSFKCTSCDVTYSYHKYDQTMKCHHCGKQRKLPRACPKCGSYNFHFGAAGTQRIETLLKERFPSANILRMDADTTTKKDAFDIMFQKMTAQDVDILVGTQMIAKGLDFENITLVGVILADVSLNIPDFRAGERTFQLLTQVAGRAGRGVKKGEVIIQTYNPEHYIIKYAIKQDFKAFAGEELTYRKGLKYPPYIRLTRVIFSSKNKAKLDSEMKQLQMWLGPQLLSFMEKNIFILGPTEPPIAKVNNFFKQHLIIKSDHHKKHQFMVKLILENWKRPSSIKVTIDVDPLSLI